MEWRRWTTADKVDVVEECISTVVQLSDRQTTERQQNKFL